MAASETLGQGEEVELFRLLFLDFIMHVGVVTVL